MSTSATNPDDPATTPLASGASACSAIQVYDGYDRVDAKPDAEGHVVIEGDGRTLPSGSKIWLVEHGCTGWWSCDHLEIKVAESGYVYSIPQNSLEHPPVGDNTGQG